MRLSFRQNRLLSPNKQAHQISCFPVSSLNGGFTGEHQAQQRFDDTNENIQNKKKMMVPRERLL